VAWYRTWAHVRRHPLTVVGFGVSIGVVAGVVLAGIAGARRTDRAFDHMLEKFHVPTATVYFRDPVDGPFDEAAGGSTAAPRCSRTVAWPPSSWHEERRVAPAPGTASRRSLRSTTPPFATCNAASSSKAVEPTRPPSTR
jgi:hypothetical protein